MPRNRLALLGNLLVATAAAAPPSAAAQQYDAALVVVLDASGSMKQSVEGGIKSDLAERGLLAMLAGLPPRAAASLRLLGEGEGADECGASREAVPFGPFDTSAWEDALDRIRWDGATPLSYSIQQAVADLGHIAARRKEILIVGDGEETCGLDPVGVARAESNGIRMHTVSLGKRRSPQLAGIALVTGGNYSMAFDETTFQEATADSLSNLPTGNVPATGGGPSTGGILEIILDVSNSMWGQVDGEVKMDLARAALAGALADLPADLLVGLRAYGHRVSYEDKERGCQDTELLLAPAAGAAADIVAAATALAPRGQTPIAHSLTQAADDLRTAGGAGTLLLISDGIESCGGNPVAVAEELRASGLEVTLHAVGLGVDADAAAALATLARAGGGEYFDAPTAEQLMSGVDIAVRSSRELILSEQELSSFPSPVHRVSGGDSVETAEVLEPGYYSFTEHLFKQERYFVVRGTPGETFTLAGMVCALAIGQADDGTATFQANPGMMFAKRLDASGEELRGRNLTVRGDMGEWSEIPMVVQPDGFAHFRIGRPFGNVHRDMLFQIRR